LTETQFYSQLFKAKKEKILEELKQFPALYWAKKWHVNNRGEEMDFRSMYYLIDLYKNIHLYTRMAVEKSVQCGLTELFIVNEHVEASKGLTVFHVLPKYEIRNRFVGNRINRVHRRVAKYANLVRQAAQEGGTHRTSLMHFGLGAIAYVGSNVEDEFIEIPVDSAYIDEKDRCNQRNLLMVPNRLTASPYKYWREISNPTIEDFGIDERYRESTRGLWMLKCDHCGVWFTPDFFKHVIRQVDANKYEVRDPDYVKHLRGARLIHDCGSPVDRLKRGEWVHEFPEREWVGFRISKLFNKHAVNPTLGTLSELSEEWIEKVAGHQVKEQVFINDNLGLPYSSKGAKIHDYELDACKRDYAFPRAPKPHQGLRFMGVDVGEVLHYVIRERVKDRGGSARRLICAGTAPNFDVLGRLIHDWQPKIVVIDAQPELHEVAELKGSYNMVYSSRFQKDQLEMSLDRDKRHLTMDRTFALDYVKQATDEAVNLLPPNIEGAVPDYYPHMTALTRILDIDPEDRTKNRFVWAGAKPDHFMLAEAYCLQADSLVPEHSVFEFFQRELGRYAQEEKSTVKSLTDAVIEGVARSPQAVVVDQETFLSKMNRAVPRARVETKSEDVLSMERDRVIAELMQDFGWVELERFRRATGMREEAARAFLASRELIDDGVRYKDGKSFSSCYIKPKVE
jgi:hypothetical protein